MRIEIFLQMYEAAQAFPRWSDAKIFKILPDNSVGLGSIEVDDWGKLIQVILTPLSHL
ncbi:MAG: hypothetical protein J7K21_04190 [Desulfurococcales archaeon]|nr:hypothetical protein [Desulfurococcales archaeon]